MKSSIFGLSYALSTALFFLAPESHAQSWITPTCTTVTGTPGVAFTKNNGTTLAPFSGSIPPTTTTYTTSIVALNNANRLFAVRDGKILLSQTAGCSWSTFTSNLGINKLSTVVSNTLYGWAYNGRSIVQLTSNTNSIYYTPRTTPGTAALIGLGTNHSDVKQVIVIDSDNQTWSSMNNGQTWAATFGGPSSHPSAYRAAFNPSNIFHVVLGVVSEGAYMTADGGAHWTRADFGTSAPINIFEVAFSPASSQVIWAVGLNINEADANLPSGGRHIYRSTNAGISFAPVIDQTSQVIIPNGMPLAPHPTDSGILYFSYGTSYGGYGTDLYRYVSGSGVTKTHNTWHGIPSMAFNPVNPNVIYLGIAHEYVQ